MTNKEDIPIIIISGKKQIKDYLGLIMILGKKNDAILIRYLDKHLDLVESMIYSLRKAFGWLAQEDPIKVESENYKCVYFDDSIIKTKQGIKRSKHYGNCTSKECEFDKCSTPKRMICKFYQQKDKTKFLINEVVIEKHGAIKGL